jgi:hypothetical protein
MISLMLAVVEHLAEIDTDALLAERTRQLTAVVLRPIRPIQDIAFIVGWTRGLPRYAANLRSDRCVRSCGRSSVRGCDGWSIPRADHGLGLQLHTGIHRIDLVEPDDIRAG